jgi:hypothetical protein
MRHRQPLRSALDRAGPGRFGFESPDDGFTGSGPLGTAFVHEDLGRTNLEARFDDLHDEPFEGSLNAFLSKARRPAQ